MSDLEDFKMLLRGHVPIITVETHEERRALEMLKTLATDLETPIFKWSVTEGLTRLDIDLGSQTHSRQPKDILGHIKSSEFEGLYILLDFHHYFSDPLHLRLIREIAMRFELTRSKLLFLSPSFNLPDEIAKLSVSYQLKLPDREALETIIREEAAEWQRKGNRRVKTDRATLNSLIRNLSGMTHRDARRLVRNAIVDDDALTESDIPEVIKAKHQLLNQDGLLSFEYDTEHFSDIGGMKNMKAWLEQRKSAFHQSENLPKGMDKPKGILLLGVQGGGKSLAAKAVAGVWSVPLLRLDFGQLYNKYIGETEKNTRQALQMAEAMAPCVLWIDEIEKGISTGGDEDGTSKRVLGTLLTWMAENEHSVFIVATANSIDDLPPELIRKGRLDEIFFVDLPDESTRATIFEIHLRKREVAPNHIDLEELARESDGFSGAEIEQAVVSVIYATHSKEKAVETADLVEALRSTKPLSVVMAEKIAHLRLWASSRTVPA